MTTITVPRELLEQARDYVHYVVDDRMNAEWIDREALERDLTAALAAAPTPPEQADARDTSAAFDSWWDAGNLMKANPYNEGTPAFWAWEGWCAAMGEPK